MAYAYLAIRLKLTAPALEQYKRDPKRLWNRDHPCSVVGFVHLLRRRRISAHASSVLCRATQDCFRHCGCQSTVSAGSSPAHEWSQSQYISVTESFNHRLRPLSIAFTLPKALLGYGIVISVCNVMQQLAALIQDEPAQLPYVASAAIIPLFASLTVFLTFGPRMI